MTASRNNVGLSLDDHYFAGLKAYAQAHDWSTAHAARVIIRQFLDYHTAQAQARPAPARRAPAIMAAEHGAAPSEPDWP